MNKSEIKKKTFSGVFWKLMERIIAQGITFIVSLVIARILSPTEYSIVGIVTVFFNFANVFIIGGLNTALIQKKNVDALDYSTVLYESLFASVIIYVILFFCAPIISDIYNQEMLVDMIRIMGLSLPITAIQSVWCSFISTKLLFKKFFFATLGGSIISGVVGLYMALNSYGVWSLVAQQMTNIIIDTMILVASTRIGLMLRFSWKRFKNLFSYAWKIFVSSLIGTTYTEISPLVIGIKFRPSDLSFYTKGKEFPYMLSATATSTISSVLFPVLAKFQDDKKRILDYTRLYVKLASFVCFPIMLGFFAVSENFVYVVLTDKWLPAVYYIRVFCVCSMFDVVAIGNCETIKAIGRSDVYLIIEIIKKTGYFVTLFLFIICSDSAHTLALAYVVCTVIQVIVNSIPNIRLIDYGIKNQIVDLLPNLIASIIMCVITVVLGKIFPLGLMALGIQIVVGMAVFLLICVASKNRSFYYFWDTYKSFVSSRRKKNNE